LHSFSDLHIDLAFEQLVQTGRLAAANGDLWLGPPKLRQAGPQPSPAISVTLAGVALGGWMAGAI
jgi:hypothetical protein